jgi:serine/threonine-protein kinase
MLVGQTIGNPDKGEFLIEKELGSGAMGTVYRSTLTLKGKKLPVALKVVSLGLLGNEGAMARFDRESAILQQLRHPHIVRLYGTGKYRGTPYIAMEFIDGEPLDRVLVRRGRLGWEEVLEYARQLCDALHHAHEKGIIHRDLKPSNLMITQSGVLKLTDFGIAKDADVTALTAANSTIGTAAYMSPEQCRGSRVLTARSDLYSLGVVMYELITGKKPFYAENSMEMFLKHVHEVPVRPSKLVPNLPVWIDNLIMHLLEKDIETRPLGAWTVGKMIRDITEKVQQHKSAGLEVAMARKIDRKLNESAELTDEDREAARALKGKSKKKKKKAEAVPLLQRTWVKAIGLGGALLGLIALGVWLSLPPSIEKAFESVSAATGESKLDAVKEFLKVYGGKAHSKVDEARALFKDLRTKHAEQQLVNRYGSDDPNKPNRRKPQDGENSDVMEGIWKAIESERGGKLKDAAAGWKVVAEKVPDVDPSQYADEEATRVTAYRWVAEKRLNDLKEVEKQHANLKAQAAAGFDDVDPFDPDTSDLQALALRGVRLETMGDPIKAHKVWEKLVSKTAGDSDKFSPHLLAAERRAETAKEKEKIKEAEAVAKRKTLVKGLADDMQKKWDLVKIDPLDLKGWRDVRIACRNIVDLYADESDQEILEAVAAARKVLKEAIPK